MKSEEIEPGDLVRRTGDRRGRRYRVIKVVPARPSAKDGHLIREYVELWELERLGDRYVAARFTALAPEELRRDKR